MKKAVILLVMLMVFGGYFGVAQAKVVSQHIVPVHIHSNGQGLDDNKALISFMHTEGEKNTKLFSFFSFTKAMYEFAPEERLKLKKAIDKYFEWEKKAKSKGVELKKNITNLTAKGAWSFGDEWSFSDFAKDAISVGFSSKSKKRHQLTLSFGKLVSRDNKYNTLRPDTLYIDYAEVKDLRHALTDKALKAAMALAKKEKEAIDADFN